MEEIGGFLQAASRIGGFGTGTFDVPPSKDQYDRDQPRDCGRLNSIRTSVKALFQTVHLCTLLSVTDW
jgi:hypothetical protein